MRLAYGTVQRKLSLDHMIERLARPVGELDARTLAALRLGLYQLAFLDGVAAHAVVGESVELAKGAKGGHKLVNAVLRRATRELPPLPADDTPAGAAIAHSYPPWLVELWWERFGGEETRALLREGAIAPVESTRLALQRAIGVGALLEDAPHDREGRAPRGRDGRRRHRPRRSSWRARLTPRTVSRRASADGRTPYSRATRPRRS
jgi:16S rRNA (cytosine967-C5)-methyltransferase